MAVEFDVLDDISVYYRYINDTVSYFYGYQTANKDYFADTINVGDMLYFCCNGLPYDESKAHVWDCLRVVVDTPVSATGYTYEWEYFKGPGNTAYIDDTTSWSSLPGLSDPSNGLTIAGTHEITFDIPSDWQPIVYTYHGSTRLYLLGGFVIRLRVTGVTSSTEGGNQGNENIQHRNYAITIRDGATYRVSDLYSAYPAYFDNVAGCYNLNANLVIADGGLEIRSDEQLVVDNWDVNLWDNGTLSIYGVLDWNPRYTSGRYNYWYGHFNMITGDFIYRRGGYTALSIASVCDIRNSVIEQLSTSNTIYFYGNSSGNIIDTALSFYNNYFYSARLTIQNMKVIQNDYLSNPYQLLAGTANFHPTITGFDWSGVQRVQATQGAFFKLINSSNVDTSKITLGTTYNRNSNYLCVIYLAKIRVIDEAGNPVQGARLYIYDKNGDSMLWHDWLRTDGYAISGLTTYDDTSGFVRKYTADMSSYVAQLAPWMSVGTNFWLRWEEVSITATGSGGSVTLQRRVGGNGLLCGYSIEPVRTLEDYITSDSDGWFKISGEYGDFYPELFVYYKAVDKDGTTLEYSANPITVVVAKEGYDPVTVSLDVNDELNLLIKLTKSRIIPDLEVI